MIRCSCEEWNKFMPFLDGIMSLALIHKVELPDDYPTWIYCPWCGEKLEPNTDNIVILPKGDE